MISNKSLRLKCAGTGKWKGNVNLEMSVHLLMGYNRLLKNNTSHKITELKNAKIFTNNSIAHMEIDVNFFMTIFKIKSQKYI